LGVGKISEMIGERIASAWWNSRTRSKLLRAKALAVLVPRCQVLDVQTTETQ